MRKYIILSVLVMISLCVVTAQAGSRKTGYGNNNSYGSYGGSGFDRGDDFFKFNNDDCGSFEYGECDWEPKEYRECSKVPEPATLLLLGLGLGRISLVSSRRKRK